MYIADFCQELSSWLNGCSLHAPILDVYIEKELRSGEHWLTGMPLTPDDWEAVKGLFTDVALDKFRRDFLENIVQQVEPYMADARETISAAINNILPTPARRLRFSSMPQIIPTVKLTDYVRPENAEDILGDFYSPFWESWSRLDPYVDTTGDNPDFPKDFDWSLLDSDSEVPLEDILERYNFPRKPIYSGTL